MKENNEIKPYPRIELYSEDFYRTFPCDDNADEHVKVDVTKVLEDIGYHIHSTQCGIGEYNDKLYYLDFKSKKVKILGYALTPSTPISDLIESAYLSWCHKEGLEHLVTGEPYESYQARYVTCLRDLYERLTNGKSLEYKLSQTDYEFTSDTSRLKIKSGRKLFVRRKTRLYPRSGFARYDFDLSVRSFDFVPGEKGSRWVEKECAPVDNTYTVDLTLSVNRTSGKPYSHLDLYNDQRFRTLIEANFACESDMVKQRLHTDGDRQVFKLVIAEDSKDPVKEIDDFVKALTKRDTAVSLLEWMTRSGFTFDFALHRTDNDGTPSLHIGNHPNNGREPQHSDGYNDHTGNEEPDVDLVGDGPFEGNPHAVESLYRRAQNMHPAQEPVFQDREAFLRSYTVETADITSRIEISEKGINIDSNGPVSIKSEQLG